MTAQPAPYRVYVRDLATRAAILTVPVSRRFARSSNYQRFLRGLVAKTNADLYYVDDSEVESC